RWWRSSREKLKLRRRRAAERIEGAFNIVTLRGGRATAVPYHPRRGAAPRAFYPWCTALLVDRGSSAINNSVKSASGFGPVVPQRVHSLWEETSTWTVQSGQLLCTTENGRQNLCATLKCTSPSAVIFRSAVVKSHPVRAQPPDHSGTVILSSCKYVLI
ncbi:hypothetical protein ACMD2_24853, partial [Ananas comosus]